MALSENNNDLHIFKNGSEKEVEKFVGLEIYSTPELVGIEGIYKNNYKDFIVREITNDGNVLDIKEDNPIHSFSPELEDHYTTFNLIKVNMDTFEAIREISRILNISTDMIHYSGLKDKCAISVQKISIKGDFVEKLSKLKIRDLFFRDITPTKSPVKLGGHWGNNFTIIIRNIENKSNLQEIIEKIFQKFRELGFPNYFGLQRFGNFRPNSHIVGHYLLEGNYKKVFDEFITTIYSTESMESRSARKNLKSDGNFEKAYFYFPQSLNYEKKMIKHMIDYAGDYEGAINTLPFNLKKLLISAFQSYLFNKMVSLRVKKGISLYKPVKGDVISILDEENGQVTQVRHIFGGPHDKFLKEAIKLNRAAIVVPIIGFDTNLDEFPLMKELFNEIIKQENISPDIFSKSLLDMSELRGSLRALVKKPTGLKILKLTDDELYPGKKKLIFEFSLQKGSYATMLLRELMK
jgi:tRNA pseudouridine13 synthase